MTLCISIRCHEASLKVPKIWGVLQPPPKHLHLYVQSWPEHAMSSSCMSEDIIIEQQQRLSSATQQNVIMGVNSEFRVHQVCTYLCGIDPALNKACIYSSTIF